MSLDLTWILLADNSERDIARLAIDLLHKSDNGEAFADKKPNLSDKSGRKC